MLRHFLRSPVLWLGLFIAIFLGWGWRLSHSRPVGYNYSWSGKLVASHIARGCLVFTWIHGGGPDAGFRVVKEPGGWDPKVEPPRLVLRKFRQGPSHTWHGMFPFRILFPAHLLVWAALLAWSGWRWRKRHACPR